MAILIRGKWGEGRGLRDLGDRAVPALLAPLCCETPIPDVECGLAGARYYNVSYTSIP